MYRTHCDLITQRPFWGQFIGWDDIQSSESTTSRLVPQGQWAMPLSCYDNIIFADDDVCHFIHAFHFI